MATKFGKNTVIKVVGGTVEFRFADPEVDEYSRALAHYRTQAKDFTDVFTEFGPHMIRSIDRNFQLEGRPRAWQALSYSTIRERERLGYGSGPILVRTGALKAGFKFSFRKQSFQIVNSQFYYGYHQRGGPVIPRRQMVVLLDEDKSTFTRLARKNMRFKQ